MSLLLVVLGASHFSASPAEKDVNAASLEADVLAQRLAIKSGQMHLKSRRSFGKRDQHQIEERSEIEIVFDKDQLRFDQKQFRGEAEPVMNTRVVRTARQVLFYSEDVDQNGSKLAPAIGERSDMKGYESGVFDPRMLGVLPFPLGIMHGFELQTILMRPDRIKTTLARETVNGESMWRIAYTRKDQVSTRIWISPSRGMSVVRSEIEAVHPMEGAVIDTVENTLLKYDNGEVWFPEKIRYQRSIKGDIVQTEEVVFDQVRFNCEVDPDAFGFKGMGVPSGANVIEWPQNPTGPRLWDGDRLVLVSAGADSAHSVPLDGMHSAHPRAKWYWALLSINAAINAAILVWLYMRTGGRDET